jgi:rhamnulokinase
LESVARIAGKKINRIFIVGGGSKNEFLNRLTARYAGLEVIAGSSEATTVGNFAIQMAALNGESVEKLGVRLEAVARYAGQLSAPQIN